MEFILRSSKHPNETHVLLQHDNWNDWWKYNTLYEMHLWVSEKQKYIPIGSVKIGHKDMGDHQSQPHLENRFTALGVGYFSVGQDVSYYQNLNSAGQDVREEILTALRDIALSDSIYNESVKYDVTRTSLLRYITTESVIGQFRRLSRGNADLTNYEFDFYPNLHTPNVYLRFSVNPRSLPSVKHSCLNWKERGR